ncbi:MAG: His/Gly/Thr/Pro-type tRNA ligase C-terminal domain-containing protein, partial [Patescibacteria group bacterium]
KSAKSIEVGNIFPLGTKYSESQKVFYTDSEGNQKPIWFASYGIGPTRIMGALVEVFHDDKGIIWPKSVAPFQVYLVSLNKNDEAEKVCSELEGAGIEVLYDDRDISAGEKFANADLLGFPYRLVISEKSGDKIEFKERNGSDVELLSLDKVISRVGEEMERLT